MVLILYQNTIYKVDFNKIEQLKLFRIIVFKLKNDKKFIIQLIIFK